MSAVAFLNTFSAIGKSISRLERRKIERFLTKYWSKMIFTPPEISYVPKLRTLNQLIFNAYNAITYAKC
jgi:hypothetical protein